MKYKINWNYFNTGWRQNYKNAFKENPIGVVLLTILGLVASVIVGILLVFLCMLICDIHNECLTAQKVEKLVDNPSSDNWEKIDQTVWCRPGTSYTRYSYTLKMKVANGYVFRVITTDSSSTTESIVFIPDSRKAKTPELW